MSNNGSSGGVGLSGLLFLVFLVLKLTGVIDWSWWWITAPLWGGLVLLVLVILVVTITGFCLFDRRKEARRRR